jgi:predicted nucleotidyltransferase
MPVTQNRSRRTDDTEMDKLAQLVEKLRNAYTDRLVSVILYGSAANHGDKLSDLNVLCVLKQVTPRELGESEPILRWWREQGHPSPLLMSEEEAHNSADSFPIEFRDMRERRKVLHGVDVIAHVQVDMRNYRAQVEHELRAKLLRLRQHGAQVLSDPQALLRLCLESVSTFCVLGRHALLLAGIEVGHDRREVVRRLGSMLNADPGAFEILLDLRETKRDVPADAVELFAEYLEFIRRMVEFVDRLEDKR